MHDKHKPEVTAFMDDLLTLVQELFRDRNHPKKGGR